MISEIVERMQDKGVTVNVVASDQTTSAGNVTV